MDNKGNTKTSMDVTTLSGVNCHYVPASPNRKDILYIKYCNIQEEYLKNKGFKKFLEIPHTEYDFDNEGFDYMLYTKNN